jgi:hypothetical protein
MRLCKTVTLEYILQRVDESLEYRFVENGGIY